MGKLFLVVTVAASLVSGAAAAQGAPPRDDLPKTVIGALAYMSALATAELKDINLDKYTPEEKSEFIRVFNKEKEINIAHAKARSEAEVNRLLKYRASNGYRCHQNVFSSKISCVSEVNGQIIYTKNGHDVELD